MASLFIHYTLLRLFFIIYEANDYSFFGKKYYSYNWQLFDLINYLLLNYS